MFCACYVKERVEINSPNNVSTKKQILSLMKNDQWLILCITMVLLLIAFATRGNIAFIYGTEFAKAAGGWEIGIFMGMWSAGGIAGALISKWLTDRYNKLAVFRWSLYLSALMAVAMYFIVGIGDLYLATSSISCVAPSRRLTRLFYGPLSLRWVFMVKLKLG